MCHVVEPLFLACWLNSRGPGMQLLDVALTSCCHVPDNVGDTLPPNSRTQKSRRSASASVVARPVTGGAAMTARRGTSLRAGSKDVAVRFVAWLKELRLSRT